MHSCVCFDVKKQVNTFTARSFHSLEARSTQNLSLSLTEPTEHSEIVFLAWFFDPS
jgi:hypothetical protein